MKKRLLLLITLIFSFSFLMILIISAKSKGNKNDGRNYYKPETPLKIIVKNIKTDFGAKGNNKNDDSFSFLAASDWLNKNYSDSVTLKLFIPRGTYLVGLQIEPNQVITNPLCDGQSFSNKERLTRKGVSLIDLQKAKNIIISGTKQTVIKYKSGLPFGGFNKQMQPVSYVPSSVSCSTSKDPSDVAILGSFISMKNCSHITIEQLDLNGNNSKLNLGGVYGECNGYEIGHDGIDIFGSENITIKNISSSYFGRDGIMTCYFNENPDSIFLENVISTGNSRQGFSLTAGTNISINNCVFSKTGIVFYSNPGSGVDIEPEAGGSCTNISFTKCKFLDNKFCGMISDNHFPYVSGISFNDCEFAASHYSSWSIWPKRMIHTVFNNCIIRGRFTHVAGIDSADRMKFNNCTITDWRKGSKDTLARWGGYLIDFGTPAPDDHFYEFNYCNFEIHKTLAITTVETKDGNSGRIFNQCNWKFYVDDLVKIIPHFPDSPSRGFLGRFMSCTFISNTFNENSPSRTNEKLYFLEIDLHNNSSDQKNTFAPQNGLNKNKFCRVQNNPAWMYGYVFQLKDF